MIINDAKTISKNLDDFIDVPDGIKRLRSEVLSLAVSGKLVPQDPSEGTAEELYEKIQEEKAKESGSRRKKIEVSPIADEEIPFEIPGSWKWVRVDDIFMVNPRNNLDDKSEVSFIPMSCVFSAWSKNPVEKEKRVWKHVKRNFTHIADSDVLLAKITPCFENGKSGIATNLTGNHAAGTTELHVFRSYGKTVLPKYLLSCLRSEKFLERAIPSMSGVAGQQRVSTDFVKKYVMALPPLAEQERIVEKVDELMKIIDDLEAIKKERDKVRSSLAKSAFHSLGLNDPSVALEEMKELVRDLDDVKELEKGILSLAVSGKLVAQDPSEGTAEELYEKIQEERTKVAKESGKKLKSYPPVGSDEIPFEIPKSWKWVRLGSLCNVQTGKRDANHGVKDGKYNFYTCAKVPIKSNTYSFEGKSLLLPGNGANVGHVMYVDEKFEAYQRTYVLNNFIENVPEYIDVVLRGVWQDSLGQQYGAAINFIRLGNITDFSFPLPSAKEQKRIVKKVDELMGLVGQLKTIIQDA